MDTHKDMSYERYIVTAVKYGFLPMYGCNFQDPISQKMEHEYHILVHTDKGLFLTSESKNEVLKEARLYYELNTTKSCQNSTTINKILDILKETNNKQYSSNNQTIFTIRYDAEINLISHLNRLNDKGLWINNPWQHRDKHHLEIIKFDEDRLKLSEYHAGDEWILDMPNAVKHLIGYK